MTTDFRFGKKRFYDDLKFKRGFSKSGDFTLLESELLSLFGETMKALETGELLPEGNQEQRFLLVTSLQLEPSSKLEKLWMKYKTLAYSRRRFHTLNSNAKSPGGKHHIAEEIFIDDDD
ncbi:DUF413 domain-containing protein [Agarivorans sp. MS3-6]|uniref:DUF413 domain-containing protein n=1 Tax=Agarivorans sp. TSD2052 TaxID=2937286 RepID=UPI00200EAA1A|nr:DUF413 domain-containing protein [Agarivorans sp. TSD2052]UPW18363.1 DUF413 domain-containing protein [Agarivorans sp. TSD2052]